MELVRLNPRKGRNTIPSQVTISQSWQVYHIKMNL